MGDHGPSLATSLPAFCHGRGVPDDVGGGRFPPDGRAWLPPDGVQRASRGGRTNRSYARKKAERVRGSSHPPGHRGPRPPSIWWCVCCHPRAGGDGCWDPQSRDDRSHRERRTISTAGGISGDDGVSQGPSDDDDRRSRRGRQSACLLVSGRGDP